MSDPAEQTPVPAPVHPPAVGIGTHGCLTRENRDGTSTQMEKETFIEGETAHFWITAAGTWYHKKDLSVSPRRYGRWFFAPVPAPEPETPAPNA